MSFFVSHSKSTVMSPSDVRTVVTNYVKSHELVSTENRRYVNLFQQFIFVFKTILRGAKGFHQGSSFHQTEQTL